MSLCSSPSIFPDGHISAFSICPVSLCIVWHATALVWVPSRLASFLVLGGSAAVQVTSGSLLPSRDWLVLSAQERVELRSQRGAALLLCIRHLLTMWRPFFTAAVSQFSLSSHWLESSETRILLSQELLCLILSCAVLKQALCLSCNNLFC